MGTSSDPCDEEIYRGPAAFSEAETRAVRWVGGRGQVCILDSSNQFHQSKPVAAVSVHAYGPFIVFPWGYKAST